MDRLDAKFEASMAGHSLEELERHPGTVYGLWPDFRLAYVNPAWSRFAADNDGEPEVSRRWPLGAPIMPAISPVIRVFYEVSYRICLEVGSPWNHEYECSSDTVFRRFRRTVYPLNDGCGLLIVNSLEQNRSHKTGPGGFDGADEGPYRGNDGFIEQCVNCRRVRYAQAPDRWDWVPDWVRRTPRRVAFGLCSACRGDYVINPAGR